MGTQDLTSSLGWPTYEDVNCLNERAMKRILMQAMHLGRDSLYKVSLFRGDDSEAVDLIHDLYSVPSNGID